MRNSEKTDLSGNMCLSLRNGGLSHRPASKGAAKWACVISRHRGKWKADQDMGEPLTIAEVNAVYIAAGDLNLKLN